MDEILNKLSKEAKKIILTSEEKREVKNILISSIEKIPISFSKDKEMVTTGKERSPYYSVWSIFSGKKFAFSMAVLLILLLGSGTTYASGALPGDLFYPIKINVNEPIRRLVAITTEAKARVEEKVVEERLYEADSLSQTGRLTEENKNIIEQGIDEATTNLNQHLAGLTQIRKFAEVSDINSKLEIAYFEYGKSLRNQLTMKNDAGNDEVASIIEKIDQKSNENNKNTESIEKEIAKDNGPETASAALDRKQLTQEKFVQIKKYIEEKKGEISIEEVNKINYQLALAEEYLINGQVKIDRGNYGEAFILFQQAKKETEKAGLLLRNDLETSNTVQEGNKKEEGPAGEQMEDIDFRQTVDQNGISSQGEGMQGSEAENGMYETDSDTGQHNNQYEPENTSRSF